VMRTLRMADFIEPPARILLWFRAQSGWSRKGCLRADF
jgi:hypothetical protein